MWAKMEGNRANNGVDGIKIEDERGKWGKIVGVKMVRKE